MKSYQEAKEDLKPTWPVLTHHSMACSTDANFVGRDLIEDKLSSNVHPMLIFLPKHRLHASEGVQGGSLDHIDHNQPGQAVNPGLGKTSSQSSSHGVAD